MEQQQQKSIVEIEPASLNSSEESDEQQQQESIAEIEPASLNSSEDSDELQRSSETGSNFSARANLTNSNMSYWALIIFFTQFAVISIIAVILNVVRALNHHLLPHATWLAPVSAATGASVVYGMTLMQLSIHFPGCGYMLFLLCFAAVSFMSAGLGLRLQQVFDHGAGNIIGVSLMLFGICFFGYVEHVRLQYRICAMILARASQHVRRTTSTYLVRLSVTVLGCAFYAVFIVCSCSIVGGNNFVLMAVVVFGLAWTIAMVRNSLIVYLARLAYLNYMRPGTTTDLELSWDDIRHTLGNISFATLAIPVCGFIGGLCRALSCITCDRVDAAAATWATRGFGWWGLVHVGVSRNDFISSSTQTSHTFREAEMEIDTELDLTRAFGFCNGFIGGSIAALVASAWTIPDAFELILCTFIIGFLVTRVSTAWTEAVIGAFHVGYAERMNARRSRADHS